MNHGINGPAASTMKPMAESANSPVFELGLVMAGAVSAGAYTAGVADFLIEALDAWDAARRAGDPLAPMHRVHITAISGASAGAMTAGIMAGIVAGRRHSPIGLDDPGPSMGDNALFDSWVNRIDADALLDTADLTDPQERLASLLNGQVLDTIARDAIPDNAGGRCRSWIGASLQLAFAITNLRGVPYNVGFGDHSGASEPRPGHSMRKHADLLRFRLVSDGAHGTVVTTATDAVDLDAAMRQPGWAQLRSAALASGAFPLLLPPKALHRPGSDYSDRHWPMPAHLDDATGLGRGLRYDTLPPHWGAGGIPDRFDFLAVDGGVLDNEPFAAARDLLTGSPPTPPSGEVLGRALISIDPFPDLLGYRQDEPQPGGLLDIALSLLAAMKNQTRFQPDELVTAFDDPYARRHLIAPSRRVGGERMDHPLAGGAVHGFAGFIDRDFRLHDFMLGRANCQRFLSRHFRLPTNHPLFADWTAAQRAGFGASSGTLPVVPLIGRGECDIPMPAWPRLPPERLGTLSRQLRRRVGAVVPRAVDHLLTRHGAAMRWATKRLAGFQSRGWVSGLIDHIRRELKDRGQI